MYHGLAQHKPLRRALLSSKVGLVFVVTFFCASLSHSSAQSQDVTPPNLTAFSFTPTTIDTSSGPAIVAVSLSATDDLSGITYVQASFSSPSGTQGRSAATSSPAAPSVSTTVDATFPQFSEAGTWTVVDVLVVDAVGNGRHYSTTDLSQNGFPTDLVVVGREEDVTPPNLTTFSFTPTTIDTSSGPAIVAVSLSATDDLSGITYVQASFSSPSGTQGRSAATSSPAAPSVSTTVDATFPQFSEAGTWTVVDVLVVDAVGNGRHYSTTDLSQNGFPTDLVVVGREEDVTPPNLTTFSFTPTTVDTSSGPAIVAVSLSATDDLSGITYVQASFSSPSGTQGRSAATSSPAAPSVSTTVDATFPQFSEAGTWTVVDVLVVDAVGNGRHYSTTDLSQNGFPTDLVVVGREEDVTPPNLTVSATPQTLWPPNGKMVPVTVSGTMTDNEPGGTGVNPSTATYAVTDEYGSVQPSGIITLGSTGSYSFTIQLQASRNEDDTDGRLYIITVSAQDNAGNKGSAATGVTAPHDQGQ